jgi:hypothetical protein
LKGADVAELLRGELSSGSLPLCASHLFFHMLDSFLLHPLLSLGAIGSLARAVAPLLGGLLWVRPARFLHGAHVLVL